MMNRYHLQKTFLLIGCLFALNFAMGQKQLASISEYRYFPNANIASVDSFAYIYNASQGSLDSLNPIFGFDGIALAYFMDYDREPFVHADTANHYIYMGSFPLSFLEPRQNTLTNGLVTTSLFGGGFDRTLYTYDGQDRLTKKSNEYFNPSSNSWILLDSTVYSYDALGNRLSEAMYQIGVTPSLRSTDSTEYQSGTSQITRYISYNYNGISLVPSDELLVTYAGSEIDYIDVYENPSQQGLEWTFRMEYSYAGGLPASFDFLEVVSNTPSTSPIGGATLAYNSQGKIELYTIVAGSDSLFQHQFTYDADGYISQEIEKSSEMGNFFTARVSNFHYEAVTVSAQAAAEIEVGVTIFPNPGRDLIQIQSASPLLEVQVLDLRGRTLLRQRSEQLNLAHLPAGTYFVVGKTRKGVFRERVVLH